MISRACVALFVGCISALVLATVPARAQTADYTRGSVYDLDPPARQATGNRILEQVLNSNDMQPVRELAEGDILRELSRPVGRLAIGLEGGKVSFCTASLIARDLIITNHHCIPGDGNVAEALLWMGYLIPKSRRGVMQYPVDVTPVEADAELDYAILRVRGNPGDVWGTIRFAASTPPARRSLVVVHHPGGFAQHITIGRCRTGDPATAEDDLLHVCDTLGGSSGAPIFDNNTRKVVAIHYSAVGLQELNAGKRIASLARRSPTIARMLRDNAETAGGDEPRRNDEAEALRKKLAALQDQLEQEQKKRERDRDRVAVGTFPDARERPQCDDVAVKTAGGDWQCIRAGSGEAFRDCPDCPEMVVVPAAPGQIGSPPQEAGRDSDEGPVRTITPNAPFAIGRTEITFAAWQACVGRGGCRHRPDDSGWGRGSQPVINISWSDARDYVRWLSRRTGQKYRLPSEAEWEIAARAGTRASTYLPRGADPEKINFDGSLDPRYRGEHAYRGKPVEAGNLTPNAYGLFNTLGNVQEWVADCWNPGHAGLPADGSERAGDCSRRVVKGGAWYYDATTARAAAREPKRADARLNVLGFRVVRELEAAGN